MDKKIISLAEENKVTELVELLSTVENEEVGTEKFLNFRTPTNLGSLSCKNSKI